MTSRTNAIGLSVSLALTVGLASSGVPVGAESIQIWNSPSPEHRVGPDAIHLRTGFDLLAKQYPEAASHEFAQCKDVTVCSDEALLLMANTLSECNDCDKALTIANLLIQRAARKNRAARGAAEAAALEVRAQSLRGLRREDEAVADCLRAVALAPDDTVDLLYTAATIRKDQRRFNEAVNFLDRLLAYDHYKNGWAMHTRVVCLRLAGRWDEAAKQCTSAIYVVSHEKQDPHCDYNQLISWLYAERAGCYAKLGKADLAAADKNTLLHLSGGLAADMFGDDPGARKETKETKNAKNVKNAKIANTSVKLGK